MENNNEEVKIITKKISDLPQRESIKSDKTHGFDIEEKSEAINKAFEETKRENIFEEIENKYSNYEKTNTYGEEEKESGTASTESNAGSGEATAHNEPSGSSEQKQAEPNQDDGTPIEVKSAVIAFDTIVATLAVMGCSMFGKTIDRKHVILTDTEITRLSKVAAPVWEKYKGSFSIEGVLIVTVLGLYSGKIMNAIDKAEPEKSKTPFQRKATKEESDKILEAMEKIKPAPKKTTGKRGRPKKQ